MSFITDRIKDNVGTLARIMWSPYVHLPESVLKRIPELREWDKQNMLRDEANRLKIDAELSRIQEEIT